MEKFEFIRNRMNLSDEELSEYIDDLNEIKEFVDKNDIKFEANYRLGFYSHMVSFLQRIKKNENLNDVDDSVKNNIEEYVLELSEKMLLLAASKYGVKLNYAEVILAAIHLQTAISMEKEGVSNE